jgi:hypothetical protein
MNEQNYASREAAERLEKAGIVLETDYYHETHGIDCYELVTKGKRDAYLDAANKKHVSIFNFNWVPAPSMAEVWRELPWLKGAGLVTVSKHDSFTTCHYGGYAGFNSTNPTDALIDLLIWVRKEKS